MACRWPRLSAPIDIGTAWLAESPRALVPLTVHLASPDRFRASGLAFHFLTHYLSHTIIPHSPSPSPLNVTIPLTFHPTENIKSANITGNKGIGKVTDGLAEGVGGQLDSDGILGGVGDATSKEGFNRAERGDTGPIDKAEMEKEQKGWSETLSGGYLGGKK